MNPDFWNQIGTTGTKLGQLFFRLNFVFRRLLLVDYDWLGQYEEDLKVGSPK